MEALWQAFKIASKKEHNIQPGRKLHLHYLHSYQMSVHILKTINTTYMLKPEIIKF